MFLITLASPACTFDVRALTKVRCKNTRLRRKLGGAQADILASEDQQSKTLEDSVERGTEDLQYPNHANGIYFEIVKVRYPPHFLNSVMEWANLSILYTTTHGETSQLMKWYADS